MKIIKNRKIYFSFSIILILVGFAFMLFNTFSGNGAFNYDIQFTGGTSIDVEIGQEFSNDEIIQLVKDNTSEVSPQVQKVGSAGTGVAIRTALLASEQREALIQAIGEKYSIEKESFSIEDISATISSEMQRAALLAVLISCVSMLIYVSVRFKDYKTGASSIIALLHDALIVLACYAVFRIPMNNTFIAAILTVLGYSINASIVIFDRVRENKRRSPGISNEDLIDSSVSQSLRRSVFTSLTTFFTIASLYVFGVQSVKEFAFPIAVGIVCGTYSSVFLAGSIWYTLTSLKNKPFAKTAKE